MPQVEILPEAGHEQEEGVQMNIRSILYRLAKAMGDARAIQKGPRAVARRVRRRVAGRLTGRLLGKLFK